MKRLLIALTAALTLLSPVVAEDLVTTLGDKEKSVLEALKQKDLLKLQSLTELQAWLVDGHGFSTPAELVLQVKFLNYKSFSMSDERVLSLDSNSALLRYKLKQSGDFRGKPLPELVFCSSAWVKKRGTWKAMFHQETAPFK